MFALFWSPVGPEIPAGVLLAGRIPLNPVVTFGLYALPDVLGAIVCHPLFTGLRRYGGRVPALRKLGKGFMKVAMVGAPMPHTPDAHDPAKHGIAPALFRVGTVGFGVDVTTVNEAAGTAGVDRDQRLGCGACVLACPFENCNSRGAVCSVEGGGGDDCARHHAHESCAPGRP